MNSSFPQRTLAAALVTAWLPATAADFKLGGDVDVKLNGAVTLGTAIRLEEPNPNLLGVLSTARVGLPPGNLGGNSGGNDLNFKSNHPVSTVLKGIGSLEVRRGAFAAFVRVKAWHDQELEEGDRPYGNIPNRFAQGVSLSDAGFDPHAKFTNARIEDAYVSGRFSIGAGNELEARLGRQVVGWMGAQLIGGGIAVVNPNDLPAQARPGALPEEGRIPVGMLQARLALGKDSSIEAFVPYEFRPTVLNPCGTFYAVANYAPTGCAYVSVLGGQGVNDPTALGSGRYPKRAPDDLARDGGQWGLALGHRWAATGTELRAYAMNYHSRTPSIRITNPNIAGGFGTLAAVNPTRLTDPNGIKYSMVWQEDIRLVGLGLTQHFNPTQRAYAELSYRPNQPLAINPSDLIAAFLQRSPTSALNLARNVLALPPGATFDGVDRYKVGALTLGYAGSFANIGSAQRFTVNVEVGASHVAGLPDPGRLRYGRSDDFGGARVTGGAPCVDNTVAQKSCAQEGFVTANAWGWRARLAASYADAAFGATLTPSLTLAQDVKGYSFDGVFLEGRMAVRPALRADWGQRWFAEAQFNFLGGGKYNTQFDRDTFTLYGGMRF